MKEVVDLAKDSNFGEFSTKVKQVLADKLRENPYIQAKADEMDSVTSIMDKFKEINDEFELKEEPSDED